MHDFINVLILACIQGLTEFLPVSSSGHLVIAQHLIGMREPGVSLEVWLHIGTLFSILLFYRQSIIDLIRGIFAADQASRKFALFIVVSTLPAILCYAILHKEIDTAFESARTTGCFLLLTGVVLLCLRWVRIQDGVVTFGRAVVIGLAQALAILPGVSRSGMTIVAARSSGVSAVRAAEFSFLMAIPLLLGAAVLDFFRAPACEEQISGWLLAFGALVSALVGYVAIKMLVCTLRAGYFWAFGIYCLFAGTLTLLLL